MTIELTLAGVLIAALLIAVVFVLIALYSQSAVLDDLKRQMGYREAEETRLDRFLNHVRDDVRVLERRADKMDANFGGVVTAWAATHTEKKEG